MKTQLKFFLGIALIVLAGLIRSQAGLADEDSILSKATRDEGFVIQESLNEPDRTVVMDISVPDLTIETQTIGDRDYTVVSLDEASSTMDVGKPMLPMIGKMYQISNSKAPVVSVHVLRSHEVELTAPVVPYQLDREIVDIDRIEQVDRNIYAQDSVYPETRFFAEDPVILRDIRLLPVAYYPVQYHPQSNTLEIIDEAELIIQMTDADSPNTLDGPGPYSPTWDHFYKALIPNYAPPWNSRDDRNAAEHYLVIMPDMFESRCQGFISWKESQGFIVDILRLSSLVNPDAAHIKQVLQDKYNSDERPVYASIFGSTNNFPIHESHDNYMSGDFDDDLYYSQLAGDDLLPDIFLSRYPVADGDELSTMLARILYYEQTPTTANAYYKTALTACSGIYASQQTVKEQTAERMQTNLHYEVIHTMYNWNSGSVSQIQEWVNQGVSLINYRGEGWQAGWHPEHAYSFEYPDVYVIQNSDMFPVITSIGCGVAMFDGYSDCFGHAWVTMGSPGNLRGAVAFMGPTWNTRTTINNWIDRGIYRGFCYHNITRSSPAFNYGKIYAYNHFLGTSYMDNDIPTHMREYVQFGNPDLWWRTAPPRTAEIYLAWCPNDDREGIVVIDETGRKLPNAQVCFLKDNERRVYITDGGGGCKVFMNDVTGSVPYTLTGWNLLPCTGNLDFSESTGDNGDLIITEIKPDIETTGVVGDQVEIANLETSTSVNLKGWTIGDLDGYDRPFVTQDAILPPHKVAVIDFVGYLGVESVTTTSYGLLIKSTAQPGMSSLEDTAVLRNPEGSVRDAVCWNNNSGIGSTNETNDLSKLTQPTSTLSVGSRAWWSGPDTVTREQYESLTVDWSAFAGNGGPGSIQRAHIPGTGEYNTPSDFVVSSTTNFGQFSFPAEKRLLE